MVFKMREKGRAAVYTMAGFYLLYLAYQMFGSRMDNGGADYVLMIIFSVLFLFIGSGMIIFSACMVKNAAKKQKDDAENTKKEA